MLGGVAITAACGDDDSSCPSSNVGQAGGGGEQERGTGGTGEGGEGGEKAGGCDGGTIECGDECVKLDSDEAHCGSCGNACDEGFSCNDGECKQKNVVDGLPGQLAYVRLAIDDDGDAVAVWIHVDDDKTLYASSFDVDEEAWSKAQKLGTGAAFPQLVLDAKGDAVALWSRYENSQDDVYVARLSKGSSSWSESLRVDDATLDADSPVVAMAGDGTTTVEWVETRPLEGNQIEQHLMVRRSTTAGAFTNDAVDLAVGATRGTVASGRGGETFVAWEDWDENVMVRRLDGDAWTETETVLLGDGHAFVQGIAPFADDDGNLTLVVGRDVTSASPSAAWVTATHFRDGAWTPERWISDGYNAYYGNAAQASNGDVFATWVEYSYPSFVPYLCGARLAGDVGTWSEPSCDETRSSAISSVPIIVVDHAGSALITVGSPMPVGQDALAARYSAATDTLSDAKPFPADEDDPVPAVQAYGRSGQGLALFLHLRTDSSRIFWEKL